MEGEGTAMKTKIPIPYPGMSNRELSQLGIDLITELATNTESGMTEPPCEEHQPLITAMAIVLLTASLDLDLARDILMAAYRLGQISKEG
jgi:hypothetical protein